MMIRSLIAASVLAASSLTVLAEDAREIILKPDAANPLMYDTKSITVKAGEKIKLTLDNKGAIPQPHNLLVVKPGTLAKVGALANGMLTDPKAAEKQYIPESEDILHHTNLIQPGQSGSVEFTVPSEAGDYPYLCTFPGHWMLMQGTMKVEK